MPEPAPEISDPRLLVALYPGAESTGFETQLASLGGAAARWLRSAAGLGHPGEHVAVVEYDGADDAVLDSASSDLAGLGEAVDRSRSICLVGRTHTFIPGRSDRTRLWYFMRRRADFDHDGYLDRYRRIHSSFGLRTPGIDAYTQFHVDLAESEQAAAALGCGQADYDSVSILDMGSLDDFLAEIVRSPVGEEAVRDEERFVDRDQSWDYITQRVGAGAGR